MLLMVKDSPVCYSQIYSCNCQNQSQLCLFVSFCSIIPTELFFFGNISVDSKQRKMGKGRNDTKVLRLVLMEDPKENLQTEAELQTVL